MWWRGSCIVADRRSWIRARAAWLMLGLYLLHVGCICSSHIICGGASRVPGMLSGACCARPDGTLRPTTLAKDVRVLNVSPLVTLPASCAGPIDCLLKRPTTVRWVTCVSAVILRTIVPTAFTRPIQTAVASAWFTCGWCVRLGAHGGVAVS